MCVFERKNDKVELKKMTRQVKRRQYETATRTGPISMVVDFGKITIVDDVFLNEGNNTSMSWKDDISMVSQQ